MIYIITKINDISSTRISKWLQFYKYPFLRINTDSINLSKQISNINISFEPTIQGNHVVYIKKYSNFQFESKYKQITNQLNDEILNSFLIPLKQTSKICINDFVNFNLNKFEILKAAEMIGFKTPKTIYTNNKLTLIKFLETNTLNEIIVKSSYEQLAIFFENNIFKQYTNTISKQEIENYPNQFLHTLIQEKIEILFDIKIIYCLGHISPIGIYNYGKQKNIDIRANIETTKTFPFKINKTIQQKIQKITKYFNIDICTIDFVMSINNELIFLEINPGGLFEDISQTNNINIEKLIAEKLIQYDSI